MRRETSRNRAAKQIQMQNILCGLGFSLYIRASPHQARDSVLRDWAGFFVARNTRFLAALCLEKCPRLIS
jgi:hypothetical protein